MALCWQNWRRLDLVMTATLNPQYYKGWKRDLHHAASLTWLHGKRPYYHLLIKPGVNETQAQTEVSNAWKGLAMST